MIAAVSASSSSRPRGLLRWVERCWPATAQARRSRFRAYADGEIRPWPGEAPATGKKGRHRAERVEDILAAAFAVLLPPHRTRRLLLAKEPGDDGHRDAVHDGVAGVSAAHAWMGFQWYERSENYRRV